MTAKGNNGGAGAGADTARRQRDETDLWGIFFVCAAPIPLALFDLDVEDATVHVERPGAVWCNPLLYPDEGHRPSGAQGGRRSGALVGMMAPGVIRGDCDRLKRLGYRAVSIVLCRGRTAFAREYLGGRRPLSAV